MTTRCQRTSSAAATRTLRRARSWRQAASASTSRTCAYWNGQLAGIAQITQLPDASLINAYKTGFIYTQIIRSGDELKTGANGYDKEFSHDVIGILANLFTQGYTSNAHALLTRAR